MNIAFFGGTGFFGNAFKRYITREYILDKKFTFISRNPTNDNTSRSLKCDVLVRNQFPKKEKFDTVIHGVSDSTATHQTLTYEIFSKAVLSTVNIANYCKQIGAKKLVYMSSGAVYGQYKSAIAENFKSNVDLLSYENYYALGKISSEAYLKNFCEKNNISLNIIRPFAFGGVDLPTNAHYALGNLIENAKNNEDLIVKGNGKDIRTYMHQDDLVDWIIKIIDDDQQFSVYNVGSENPINIFDLAKKIVALSKKKLAIKVTGKNIKYHSIYIPDCNKFKKEFQVSTTLSLDIIINEMLNNY